MFHLVSYWWFRRTQYIPECWTPVNPRLFESPMPFMLSPELSGFSTEIITVIDSAVSLTERSVLTAFIANSCWWNQDRFALYIAISQFSQNH